MSHKKTEFSDFTSGEVNVGNDQVLMNIQRNIKLDMPWFKPTEKETKEKLCIVGSGPTLNKTYKDIDGKIMAVNGAYDFLMSKGIKPDYHLLLDAHPLLLSFIQNPDKNTKYLVASQCDPAVFMALRKYDVSLWHSDFKNNQSLLKLLEPYTKAVLIGGGENAILRGLYLGYLMGYRDFNMYGFDCSFEDQTHAYKLTGEIKKHYNGREVHTHSVGGEDFKGWGAHYRQAGQFKHQAAHLIELGCRIHVQGHSLASAVLKELKKKISEQSIQGNV
jgi:hypothetical protein